MYNLKIIKTSIIDKNSTQKEIAEIIGISEITLSKWINGKIGNINKFLDLCKYLDIDINDITKE